MIKTRSAASLALQSAIVVTLELVPRLATERGQRLYVMSLLINGCSVPTSTLYSAALPTMSRLFVIIIVLFALVYSLPLLVYGLPNSDDCDVECKNLPKTRNIQCIIKTPFSSSTFYVDCDSCDDSYCGSKSSCEVYVGMNVLLDCDSTGTQLYRNGEPLGNGSSMRLPYVQLEDEGLYECKTTANGTVSGQTNLTVKAEALVAVSQIHTTHCKWFYCRDVMSKGGCCIRDLDAWMPADIDTSFPINVYGEDPNVTVEAIWLNHYPVDLKIQVLRDNYFTSEMSLVLGAKPFKVDETDPHDPEAVIMVNATNSYASSAACFLWGFPDGNPQVLFVNTSLPSNETVSVGESAIFTCQVALDGTIAHHGSVEIEYMPSIGEAPDIVCTSDGFQCECTSDSCPVEINTMKNSEFGTDKYTYNITIPDVTEADSGGKVSCALRYMNDIQWKREAWLSVTPITVTSTPSVSTANDGDTLNKLPYIAIAPSLLVLLLVAAMVILIIVWRKRNSEGRTGASDTVPLNGSNSHSDSSSLSEEMNSEFSTLPAIEVTGTQSIPLARSRQPYSTQSMDSGVIQEGSLCSSLDEDTFQSLSAENTQVEVHDFTEEARTQVTVLGAYVHTERSHSLSDLLDIPGSIGRRQLRIYLSYTDLKAGWVLGYLKPLIESYQNTVVSIHEADMIAGHPISEERLRLIFEADKIVIVCSPDYGSSPWCQYELYQAITKQPSLAQGRIIPVLCDGCTSAPDVIRSVVTLRDYDEMFVQKLRAALFRIHRSSH